ncbi:hypothetical protein [Sanguibacter sp. HDW7]|uniref:hypothetical protein n=1 Tax=Sanguibacter sp. HDW7 TaxID=2714931 RepID=UPI001409D9A6|nr:hypothetical protein [Sanguibacter sp. HDW7]QIK83614.1 hypothetical protein G7063_08215 [Sanguibacter sp. HDW7]
MRWSEVVVLVVAVVGVVLVVGWRAATRLDRLHRKVVASRIALDAQLVRRSSAAGELVVSGALDPVAALLVADAVVATGGSEGQGGRELAVAVPDLADEVRGVATGRVIGEALGEGLGSERTDAESDLSAALRGVLDTPEEIARVCAVPGGSEVLEQLSAAWFRVQLARRFHNEAVAQTQRMRAKGWVRLARLAGRAAMPHTVELDDAWPVGLGRPGSHVQPEEV